MVITDEQLQAQLKLEEDYKNEGREALKKAMNELKAEGKAALTHTGQSFFYYRINSLRKMVAEWYIKTIQPKGGVKPSYVFCLEDMVEAFEGDNDAIIDLMTVETLNHIISSLITTKDNTILNNVGRQVGTTIQAEYTLIAFEKWLKEYGKEKDQAAAAGIKKRVGAKYRSYYINQAMKKCEAPSFKWDEGAKITLGTQLITIAEAATGYFNIVTPRNSQAVLEPTQAFVNAWAKNEDNILNHAFRLCPMIIPPKPWVSYEEGGYYGELAQFSKLLRLKGSDSHFSNEYMARLSQLDLSKVLKAVNALQATAWVVNQEVLKVMLYYKHVLGMLPCSKEERTDDTHVIFTAEAPKPCEPLPENPSEEQVAHYKELMAPWYKSEGRRKGLSIRASAMVNTAASFAQYEAIYFPCNMDFRGRLYPIPMFSFQGDDLAKGLLLFKDAPTCTDESAYKFMAITGANLAGVDKVSYDDRIQWVLDNEKQILSVAVDPLADNWWLKQDNPTQMLAWCLEWKKMRDYQEAHNGSIVGWSTGFPYAQDGTCSGLQHFSAILRDPIGGEAVNLTPQDKPNDIYAKVADKVNEVLKVDAVNGSLDTYDEDKGYLKFGTKTLAQLWLNHGVNRKVTKRPTMTLAYGAKQFGYKEQIIEETINPAIRNGSTIFTKTNKNQAAQYMAKLIWDAVQLVVVKAVEGMDWLHKCARQVCKNANVVSWVTPMGLLIQQHYLKYDVKVIQLRCQGKKYRVYAPYATGEINKTKQSNAVAPNFIHSMDAAHLQLTINNAVDQDIHHFAMIHDSYGCPMSQASLMFKVVRESFVQMYTEHDVLKDFAEDLQPLSEKKLPKLPSKDNLDLNVVLESPYIFC